MDSFVQFLSDPNVAYLFLTLGALGVLAELFHPGAILPGVTGAILMILSFIGLGHLPFSWGGLALLALAAGLFALELTTGLSGILSLVALVAFVLGSFALYEAPQPGIAPPNVSPWLVVGMAILMGAFFVFVLRVVRRSRHAPITGGIEALQHTPAVAISRLNPRGKVKIEGEVWSAELEVGAEPVEADQSVRVTGVEGVVLKVRGLPVAQPDWTDVTS